MFAQYRTNRTRSKAANATNYSKSLLLSSSLARQTADTGPKAGAAAFWASVMLALNPGPAVANQAPVTPSTAASSTGTNPTTKTYVSGLQPVYTLTSNSGATTTVPTGTAALNSVGGVLATQLSPTTMLATTDAFQVDVSASGCSGAVANTRYNCANRGTLTIDFGRAVTNPILHLSGLGGNASAGSTSTGAQARYHVALVLTSSVGSLSATPFTVVGSASNLTAATTGISVTAVNGSAGCAAGAGCGSIRVNGTVTRLEFQLDLSTSFAANNTSVISATAADRFNITASVDEDYADAPATYNTPSTSHVIGGLYLGSGVTVDNATVTNTGAAVSPVANAGATGDTDDGVTMPAVFARTVPATVPVSVTGSGTLHAWFDWNGNGVFDAAEKVATAVADGGAGDTDGAANGIIALAVTPPSTAVTTQTFARFRFSSATTVNATGLLPDGEVEDYALTVRQASKLVTTKVLSAGTSTPNVGDTISYQISVVNNGPDQATGVTLTDLLPAGLTAAVGNGTVSQGTYDAGSGLWTIGSLNSGATSTLTLSGTVNAGTGGTTITNTTTAASTPNQYDPDTAGDDLAEAVTVLRPVAAAADAVSGVNGVSGATGVVNAFAGDTINGVAASPSNSVLSVAGGSTVPAGLTFNTATGSVDVAAGTPSGTYSFDYQICEAGVPTNCKTATITVTVAPTTDLSITKTNTPGQNGEVDLPSDTVEVDSQTTYTVTVTNNGSAPVTGAIVSDSNYNFLECDPATPINIVGPGAPIGAFTFADLMAGLPLGTLPPGQSVVITYQCKAILQGF